MLLIIIIGIIQMRWPGRPPNSSPFYYYIIYYYVTFYFRNATFRSFVARLFSSWFFNNGLSNFIDGDTIDILLNFNYYIILIYISFGNVYTVYLTQNVVEHYKSLPGYTCKWGTNVCARVVWQIAKKYAQGTLASKSQTSIIISLYDLFLFIITILSFFTYILGV